MGRIRKLAASVVLTGMLIGGSLVAAAPAEAATPCGFYPITTGSLGGGEDGRYEKATYNNCKSKPVKITVRYYYANRTMCVSPGTTTLYANPALGALVGASWTKKYC